MKEIKATIQPHMLSKVISALHEMPYFPGLTIFKCEGHGQGTGPGGTFVATEDSPFYDSKVRIEIICPDEMADGIISIILKNAHTGNIGDGIITITNLETVIRVRTGEKNNAAL